MHREMALSVSGLMFTTVVGSTMGFIASISAESGEACPKSLFGNNTRKLPHGFS
jgi:hypothetical protein